MWAKCVRSNLVWLLFFLLLPHAAVCNNADYRLAPEEREWVGQQIFLNETSGKREKLTFWSEAEEFPSFGVGHFIWIPEKVEVPFESTFVQMVAYVSLSHPVQEWVRSASPPWKTRAEFEADFHSPRMQYLRDWLDQTRGSQTEFIVHRFYGRIRHAIESVPEEAKEDMRSCLDQLMQSQYGQFALIDYVNFKGFGDNQRERYQGVGWGVMQVLEAMQTWLKETDPDVSQDATKCSVRRFGLAAEAVLQRRIALSPVERNEIRWMPGWRKRVYRYFQLIPGASENVVPIQKEQNR